MLFSWLHQTQVNIYKIMHVRPSINMTVEVISIKIITSINSTNMSLVLDVQTKSTTTQRCPGLRWWFASTAPRHWRGCCTRYTRSCSTRQRSSSTRSCSLPTTQKQVNAHHHRAPSSYTIIVHHATESQPRYTQTGRCSLAWLIVIRAPNFIAIHVWVFYAQCSCIYVSDH